MEFVWLVLAIGAMAAMAWLGLRIEPHWVSKDGRRILCMGQVISPTGESITRWRETKVFLAAGRQVQVEQKRRLRRRSSSWTIEAESAAPPRRRAVFVVRGHDIDGSPAMMALKMPANSRAVEILRAHGR
ncbi:MAG: hypothetical protein RI958_770 [Actinomycetota bacterium]